MSKFFLFFILLCANINFSVAQRNQPFIDENVTVKYVSTKLNTSSKRGLILLEIVATDSTQKPPFSTVDIIGVVTFTIDSSGQTIISLKPGTYDIKVKGIWNRPIICRKVRVGQEADVKLTYIITDRVVFED